MNVPKWTAVVDVEIIGVILANSAQNYTVIDFKLTVKKLTREICDISVKLNNKFNILIIKLNH